MNRIQSLDGLRGLAVLFVFLSHTSGRGQSLSSFLNFHGIGHIGVYLFFTLSAFLLGLGLFSKPLNSFSLKKFFIKRFFRIAPLYYFVITSVFIFQYTTNSYNDRYLHVANGLQGYLQHLYFFRGDGVFWSIVSEMQFYLIVPILSFILIKFKQKGVIFLLVIAFLNFILYLGKYGLNWDYILYVSPNTLERGTFIDVFIPGLILAYFAIKREDLLTKYKDRIHKVATLLFTWLTVMTLILVSKKFLIFNQPFYEFRFFSIFYASIFSLFILSLYFGNPYLLKFFRNKILRHIGVIGFSFYLIHFAVFQFINQFMILSTYKFLISFVIVTAISTVLYYVIEKPSIKFSYKLISFFKLNN